MSSIRRDTSRARDELHRIESDIRKAEDDARRYKSDIDHARRSLEEIEVENRKLDHNSRHFQELVNYLHSSFQNFCISQVAILDIKYICSLQFLKIPNIYDVKSHSNDFRPKDLWPKLVYAQFFGAIMEAKIRIFRNLVLLSHAYYWIIFSSRNRNKSSERVSSLNGEDSRTKKDVLLRNGECLNQGVIFGK